jgi:hypothetical protein
MSLDSHLTLKNAIFYETLIKVNVKTLEKVLMK